MVHFWVVCLLTALAVPSILGKAHPPVKDGFYRISSHVDDNGLSGYLTATRKPGRPHEVDTLKWESLPTQEWKVKTNDHGGVPLQLIRNEIIRDNEVTKAVNDEPGPRANDFKPVDWNMIPSETEGYEGYFQLSNGFDCLENEGLGKRVKLVENCDDTLPAQLWKFQFLFKIPPVKATGE